MYIDISLLENHMKATGSSDTTAGTGKRPQGKTSKRSSPSWRDCVEWWMYYCIVLLYIFATTTFRLKSLLLDTFLYEDFSLQPLWCLYLRKLFSRISNRDSVIIFFYIQTSTSDHFSLNPTSAHLPHSHTIFTSWNCDVQTSPKRVCPKLDRRRATVPDEAHWQMCTLT